VENPGNSRWKGVGDPQAGRVPPGGHDTAPAGGPDAGPGRCRAYHRSSGPLGGASRAKPVEAGITTNGQIDRGETQVRGAIPTWAVAGVGGIGQLGGGDDEARGGFIRGGRE